METLLPYIVIFFSGIVPVAAMVLVFYRPLANWRLRRSGEQAPARILAVKQTRTSINHMPVIAFEVSVTPPRGRPFQAVARQAVPLVWLSSVAAPGASVTVRYRPSSLRHVYLELETLRPANREAPSVQYEIPAPDGSGETLRVQMSPFLEGFPKDHASSYFLERGTRTLATFQAIRPGGKNQAHYTLHFSLAAPRSGEQLAYDLPVRFDIEHPVNELEERTARALRTLLAAPAGARFEFPVYLDPDNPRVYVARLSELAPGGTP